MTFWSLLDKHWDSVGVVVMGVFALCFIYLIVKYG